MSSQTAKKNQTNGSGAKNGTGHKINSNIRVSAEYSNDMKLALRDEQKTDLVLQVEEAVEQDVRGFVEYARTVLDTRTTAEKVVELLLKTAFANDKYYQDWKKKNQPFFASMMEQPKNDGNNQTGASFGAGASGNGNGHNKTSETVAGSDTEADEDDELLSNLQEVQKS